MLTLPAVALPIFLVLGLATRGISLGERWRSWSIFGIAMTLVPFFLIFLEIIALIVVLIFAGVYLLTQPDFVFEMQQLSRQIYILGPESEAVQDLLIPYISKPAVLAVALFYFALLVPMMEELLKPLGVWLFARRIDSPAQGFALGALSGAAYALIETFGVSVQTIDWASLLLSRIGTGMLHVTSSALMGAAIVYAIRQRRYLLLLGTYIVSVTLHGFWNTLALLYGFSTVTETLGEETFFNEIQTPLMIGLAVLAAIFLVILVLSNRRLRLILPAPLPEETIR
jgi:RsiW-degrading membrane proteinase PrsW (M82 family)